MDQGVIAARYARAIYEYAAGKNDETALYEGMQLLNGNFNNQPLLRQVLSDPTISQEEKIKVITTAGGIGQDAVAQQVIHVVLANDRAAFMESIARNYVAEYRRQKGIQVVYLITVDPDCDGMKHALLEVIAKETPCKIEFHTKTDPNLIGGFVLEIEDKRLDASVKEQLRLLGSQL
ncbi:MAG: F0F1 ATP synthase subunit delta [Candidatus Symbiothrix sp.]|jgi:F-type H+-transporting ATPase subunit delta|nr:F0F1 ATP synthase subunit delta [Candidatus Symbiothrix sp.]